MSYGVQSSGFITKRLADSKTELNALFRATFGAGIKTTPDTVFGKLIGVFAEREAEIWELAESVYNSAYPGTASAINLDKVGEITNIVRNSATNSTVTAYMAGTSGTYIPATTLFAVQDSGDQFKTLAAATLSGAPFTVTITSAASVATATKVAHGRVAGSYIFITNAVETEYNGLVLIDTVPTADTFTYAITGSPASPATGTITASPATPVLCQSASTGPIVALAGTLNSIVNNISGLTRVDNYLDAVIGQNQETDTEFRLRRITTLAGIAAARLEGIRARLLLVSNVTSAKVFENTTLTVDGNGRPAKSIECLVLGGTNQDILDAVWDAKAAGIETYGSVSGTVTDSQGITHTTKFSRPTSVDIYLELDITVTGDFPSDGDDLVKAAILVYGSSLAIGDDVIVFPYLITSFGAVPGITDVVVRIDDAVSPTLDANVVIADTSLAIFDTSRITIAHV